MKIVVAIIIAFMFLGCVAGGGGIYNRRYDRQPSPVKHFGETHMAPDGTWHRQPSRMDAYGRFY